MDAEFIASLGNKEEHLVNRDQIVVCVVEKWESLSDNG
jgi:hypothetical protein